MEPLPDHVPDPLGGDLALVLLTVTVREPTGDLFDRERFPDLLEGLYHFQDLRLGVHPPFGGHLALIGAGKVFQVLAGLLVLNDGEQRHKDLVESRLDGTVDETLHDPAFVAVPEAEQEQSVA